MNDLPILSFHSSFDCREYLYGGVKIIHGDEPSFATRWNPIAQTKNHLFVSHHLAYNEKERETVYYNCDEFIQSLDIGKKTHLNTDQSLFVFSFECLSTREKSRKIGFEGREDSHSKLCKCLVGFIQSKFSWF